MAVYHFHAKAKCEFGDSYSLDGLVDLDGEPAINTDWFENLRDDVAGLFEANVSAKRVQILSLTRISG